MECYVVPVLRKLNMIMIVLYELTHINAKKKILIFTVERRTMCHHVSLQTRLSQFLLQYISLHSSVSMVSDTEYTTQLIKLSKGRTECINIIFQASIT